MPISVSQKLKKKGRQTQDFVIAISQNPYFPFCRNAAFLELPKPPFRKVFTESGSVVL
ncbi:hypothetical protein GCM10011418_23130 [Sphingobacterium alkalisoli]|nr:hypothetical protein GCM10011418_23130 [Sphingobacterium alkalisoli]